MNKFKPPIGGVTKLQPPDPQVGGRFERLPDESLRSLDTRPAFKQSDAPAPSTPPVTTQESE